MTARALLLAAALTLTACGDAEGGETRPAAPPEPPAPPRPPAAESLIGRTADGRTQTDVDHDLLRRIQRGEPATFGAVWVEQKPVFQVVVTFTKDPEATLRRWTTDPMYVARLAPRTATEVNAAANRAFAALKRMGVGANGGTDVKTATVKIDVLNDWERVEAAVASGRLQLPPWVHLRPPAPLRFSVPPPAPGAPYLAVAKPRGGAEWMALAGGRLVVEDGCIRLKGGDAPSTLVIWRGNHALDSSRPGELRIVDRFSGSFVRVGDEVELGGGGGDRLPVDPSHLEGPIPPACRHGPYWLAGSARLASVARSGQIADAVRWEMQRDGVPYAEALRRVQARIAAGGPPDAPPPAPPAPPPPPR